MKPDTDHPSPSPEELALRQKEVRKWVLLRGILLGALLAAWWILFAPDSLMEPTLKYILGVVAGLVATGSYLFNLRETLFPKAGGLSKNGPEQVG